MTTDSELFSALQKKAREIVGQTTSFWLFPTDKPNEIVARSAMTNEIVHTYDNMEARILISAAFIVDKWGKKQPFAAEGGEVVATIEISEKTINNIRKSLWNGEYNDDEARKPLVYSDQELLDYFIERYTNHPVITDDYFDQQVAEAHEWYAKEENQ